MTKNKNLEINFNKEVDRIEIIIDQNIIYK